MSRGKLGERAQDKKEEEKIREKGKGRER